MGQAFRRLSGTKIKSSSVESFSKVKNSVERRQAPAAVKLENSIKESEGAARVNPYNVLEERDPLYDVMLNQMVGRIRAKPGGKLETGEAVVVEKYNRPMPKLRNTTVDSSRCEEKPAPAGTLNVTQLRHILLLHQGKADDHDGPMDIPQIAARFRVDTFQIQTILKSISLLPEFNKPKEDQ